MQVARRWRKIGEGYAYIPVLKSCKNSWYNIHGTKSSTENLGKSHEFASQMRSTNLKVPLKTSRLNSSLKLHYSTDFQKLYIIVAS
jgi:hypothetical protein